MSNYSGGNEIFDDGYNDNGNCYSFRSNEPEYSSPSLSLWGVIKTIFSPLKDNEEDESKRDTRSNMELNYGSVSERDPEEWR